MTDRGSALVSGSLGGIGLAAAEGLARLGCDITLNGFAGADVIEAVGGDPSVECAGAIPSGGSARAGADCRLDQQHAGRA